MTDLFKFKLVNDKYNRLYGVALRLFGVDLSVLFTFYADEWILFNIKLLNIGYIIRNLVNPSEQKEVINLAYVHVLFVILSLTWKSDLLYEEPNLIVGVDV